MIKIIKTGKEQEGYLSALKKNAGFIQHHFQTKQRRPIYKIFKSGAGFTLTELLVAVVIALLILLIISSVFTLNQRTARKSNVKAELTQNARITLDLMSREIRQAAEIVTVLPADDSNPDLIAHELQFEDGHVSDHIQYLRYYLEAGDLKRQIIAYYFSTAPSTYVHWNDVDAFGPPEQTTLEIKTIGENFSNIDFYGGQNVNIELILEKRNETVEIKSIIAPRNI